MVKDLYLSNRGSRLSLIVFTLIWGAFTYWPLILTVEQANLSSLIFIAPALFVLFVCLKFSIIRYNEKQIIVENFFGRSAFTLDKLGRIEASIPYLNVFTIELDGRKYWFTNGSTRYIAEMNTTMKALELEAKLRAVLGQ